MVKKKKKARKVGQVNKNRYRKKERNVTGSGFQGANHTVVEEER